LGLGILSSETLKNARENPAWKNLAERFAILLGIDTQGHRLPRVIADQADRKLVGTLAGNDGRALDPSHDEDGRRPDRVRYLTCQTHSAGGYVRYVVDTRLTANFDEHFFLGGEALVDAAARLLDADQAANHQHHEIVPGPEQVERSTILDQVGVVERKGLGKAQDRDEGNSEEAEEQPPLNVQAGMVNSLGGDFELVALRTYQRSGYDPDDLGRDEHLVDVRNQRQHAAAAEPGCNGNLRNHHGGEVLDRVRKVGLHHTNVE
jgi:hypothetical protein